MTGRFSRFTAVQVLRALACDGWERVRRGKHIHLRHPTKPGRVEVPYHPGRTIKLKTLSHILDRAGLTTEELRELLEGESP